MLSRECKYLSNSSFLRFHSTQNLVKVDTCPWLAKKNSNQNRLFVINSTNHSVLGINFTGSGFRIRVRKKNYILKGFASNINFVCQKTTILNFCGLISEYLSSMGETSSFWYKHIVTSPSNLKTLHKQIIADIYKPFSSADIRNYLRIYNKIVTFDSLVIRHHS